MQVFADSNNVNNVIDPPKHALARCIDEAGMRGAIGTRGMNDMRRWVGVFMARLCEGVEPERKHQRREHDSQPLRRCSDGLKELHARDRWDVSGWNVQQH
jgi:hypothetical protein